MYYPGTLILLTLSLTQKSCAIRCYQCASSAEADGLDTCGAYNAFDESKNLAVECTSPEAVTPGTFCMKEVHQGPIGFIWDRRWRQVIRRCATVAELGVTNACYWMIQTNGEYVERCFCSTSNQDETCNSSPALLRRSIAPLALLSALVAALFH